MPSHRVKPPTNGQPAAAIANTEPLLDRIFNASVNVVFIAVAAVVLMAGAILVVAVQGYRSAWERFCQRDYAVGAISAVFAIAVSVGSLSLVGLGVGWFIEW